MSDFTAKVYKATDVIISVDEYTLDKLDAIEGQRNHTPSLASSALSLLNPLSAFLPRKTTLTESLMKQLFLNEAALVAKRITPVLGDAIDLNELFEQIKVTLDRLQELEVGERDDILELNVLLALWQQVAQPGAHAENLSHQTLLGRKAREREKVSG